MNGLSRTRAPVTAVSVVVVTLVGRNRSPTYVLDALLHGCPTTTCKMKINYLSTTECVKDDA